MTQNADSVGQYRYYTLRPRYDLPAGFIAQLEVENAAGVLPILLTPADIRNLVHAGLTAYWKAEARGDLAPNTSTEAG